MDAMRYVRKPRVVEALKWDGSIERAEKMSEFARRASHYFLGSGRLAFRFGDSVLIVQPGEWLVKDAGGILTAVANDDFEREFDAGLVIEVKVEAATAVSQPPEAVAQLADAARAAKELAGLVAVERLREAARNAVHAWRQGHPAHLTDLALDERMRQLEAAAEEFLA